MKVLVTGATGFIGGNLVLELLKQKYEVRALVRKESNRRNIDGLNIEMAWGDLRERESLDRALDGCDALFHVAAAYSFWSPDPRAIYDANVRGTQNILSAALDKHITKVVYTSTEATIGIARGCLGTECGQADVNSLPGHYKKSKYLAERIALEMCRRGLPLVIVNPTTPIGPRDVRPTPTGQIIVDFINGKMPACTNTGLNVVDVGDVARGHILALERGQVGEKYVLGNRNLTLRQILDILAKITGRKAPELTIPLWLALGVAYVDEFVSGRVMRRHPRVPVAAVKAAQKFRHFDCTKAVTELGMPQTPVEEAFQRAVAWFQDNGYVKQGAGMQRLRGAKA